MDVIFYIFVLLGSLTMTFLYHSGLYAIISVTILHASLGVQSFPLSVPCYDRSEDKGDPLVEGLNPRIVDADFSYLAIDGLFGSFWFCHLNPNL